MVCGLRSSPRSQKQVPPRPLGPDGIPRGVSSNPPKALQDPTPNPRNCPSGGPKGTDRAADPGARPRTPHGSRGLSGNVENLQSFWKKGGTPMARQGEQCQWGDGNLVCKRPWASVRLWNGPRVDTAPTPAPAPAPAQVVARAPPAMNTQSTSTSSPRRDSRRG